MKKYLLLTLISCLGYSQQVLKKITNTSESTTVELYTFRNGTSSGNVVGNENFSGSTTFEDINFYAANDGTVFSSHVSGGPGLTPTSEVICNGTFQEIYWTGYFLEFCNDTSNCDNATALFPISVFCKWSSSDATSDNNNEIDLSKILYTIPTSLNGGATIPTGTWVVLGSRYAMDGTAGIFIEKVYVSLRFDGNAWILQTTFPDGTPISNVPDVCATTMNIADNNPTNAITISPNPVNGFITVQKEHAASDNFKYKIIDLSGKVIRTGQSTFGFQINIGDLATGNYVIEIKDELGLVINKKLIKK